MVISPAFRLPIINGQVNCECGQLVVGGGGLICYLGEALVGRFLGDLMSESDRPTALGPLSGQVNSIRLVINSHLGAFASLGEAKGDGGSGE